MFQKQFLSCSASAGLRNLQSINLSFTLVTDIGLKKISGLSSLKSLNLDNRQITDTGLAALTSMLLILFRYIFFYSTESVLSPIRNFIDRKLFGSFVILHVVLWLVYFHFWRWWLFHRLIVVQYEFPSVSRKCFALL